MTNRAPQPTQQPEQGLLSIQARLRHNLSNPLVGLVLESHLEEMMDVGLLALYQGHLAYQLEEERQKHTLADEDPPSGESSEINAHLLGTIEKLIQDRKEAQTAESAILVAKHPGTIYEHDDCIVYCLAKVNPSTGEFIERSELGLLVEDLSGKLRVQSSSLTAEMRDILKKHYDEQLGAGLDGVAALIINSYESRRRP